MMTDEEGMIAKSEAAENELPPEVEQMIDSWPEEGREQMRQMMSISMSMMTRTSPQAEMVKRMTPENFQKILENESEETKLAYKDKSETRKATIIAVSVVVAFLIAAMLILRDQPDLLKEIIIPLLTFVAGALSGYGFGSRKKKDDD